MAHMQLNDRKSEREVVACMHRAGRKRRIAAAKRCMPPTEAEAGAQMPIRLSGRSRSTSKEAARQGCE